MPGLIGVSEFLDESREDYSSPTTSSFVSRMPECRQTVASLEEVSDVWKFLFFIVELVKNFFWKNIKNLFLHIVFYIFSHKK